MTTKTLIGDAQIPVVHESRAITGNGILTERQKAWVEGASNDIYVENPVLYRHLKSQKAKTEDISINEIESTNIRGLISVNLDEPKSSGGIIEKIQKGRKERHEATMEDMMQELATISLEIEPQVQEACVTVKGYLEEDSREIQQTMMGICDDMKLISYSLQGLKSIWKAVEKHSLKREKWINDLDHALNKIEETRSLLISDVITFYTKTLERIAHLMPPDVHRLMEGEVATINSSMIANQTSYADLMRRLLTADVERERKQFTHWKNRVEDWKALRLQEAVKKHIEFMNSEQIINAPCIQRHLNDLVNKQKTLNGRRLELLNQLKEMKPPSSTKTAVYQWNKAITEATDQLDQVHMQYLSLIQLDHEKILYECDHYVKNIMNDLFNTGVVSENILEELSHETFLPLLGERKAIFDYELEKLEKNLTEITADQKQDLKALLKFSLGAAHVWDNHELGLTKEERTLQEMLDKNRRDHDYQNQIKEAKLDIVMDRMRQDSTGETLESSLNQALAMMEGIQKGYLDFHSMQKETCEKYPRMIQEELKRYTASVCSFFHVSKQQQITDGNNDTEKIVLANGASYYVIDGDMMVPDFSGGRSDRTTQKCMATFDDDVEFEVLPYVESFSIPDELFEKLKESMRLEFLEHLEKWKTDAVTRSERVMVTKIEEVNNELDLRLHLHEPRSKRAEKDVHDVRAEELVLHRNRVEQHRAGIAEKLQSLKSCYQDMLNDHVNENDKFRQSVEELEVSFHNATSTNELKAMQDQVNGKMDKYMEIIRASVRHFRYNLDDMLNKLRISNAQFRKSMKIFSEGGNFSPDEVEEYRKRLEKVATRIDNCEGSLIGELEGMETKRMEIAKEFAGKLEDRFKHHLFDLTFIEKIKRWLTNIQVKVKGEVANSNSQSQHLSKMISVFSRRLDQIKNPSVDNKKVSVEELHETLLPLINSFRNRIAYLDCAVKGSNIPNVQTSHDTNRQDVNTWKGKTKRLLKKQSTKPKVQRVNSQQTTLSSVEKNPACQLSVDGLHEEETNNASDSPRLPIGFRRLNSTLKTPFGGKYDKRYLAFGECNVDMEPENNFLALQVRLLQTGLDGLLSSAELYYRHKGQRASTRPRFIGETFDACAESLIQRLKKYKEQTVTYHNSCIQELRAQIKLFTQNIQQLPLLLTTSLTKKHEENLKKAESEIQSTLEQKKERIDQSKRKHQTLLRPTLGHPNNKNELIKLNQSESSRQTEADKMLNNYEHLMKECQKLNFGSFTRELQDLVVALMSQFDVAVTVDDVIEGALQTKPKSEKQLLKEKLHSTEDGNVDVTATVTAAAFTWPDLDLSFYQDIQGIIHDASLILTPVVSVKSTHAHEAVIRARDKSFKDYYEHLASIMTKVKKTCEQLKVDEERWKMNWETSLRKISELY